MIRWLMLLCFISASSAAQIPLSESLSFSGFGTLTAAKSDSVTPVKDRREITDQWCYDCDTTLGLQLDWQMAESVRSVVQLLKRPQDHFSSPEFERVALEYVHNDVKINVGRLRTPLFIMSEYYYVASAYPWLRLPFDVYGNTLGVTHYEGLVLDWSQESTQLGQLIISPFYALPRTESVEQYGQSFDIDLSDMVGVAGNWHYEDHQIHAAYLHINVEQKYSAQFTQKLNLDIFSLGISYVFNQWHFQSELLLTPNYHANWYASLDYTWNKLTPYLTYGQRRRSIDTQSYVLGTTYALTNNINLYAEWEHIYGQPARISGQFTLPQDPAQGFDTQVNVVSLGLSFTF